MIYPAQPDAAVLEAAVALARVLAMATLAERAGRAVDFEKPQRAIEAAQHDIEAFVSLKTRVTRTANDVNCEIDRLGRSVAARLAEGLAELDRPLDTTGASPDQDEAGPRAA